MQAASAPMPPSSFSSFVPSSSLATSSYRDRTAEFLSIAERLKKAPGGPQLNGDSSASGQPAAPPAGHPSATSAQSEFNRQASRIGLSIHQTTQKLQKLAKRECLGDDQASTTMNSSLPQFRLLRLTTLSMVPEVFMLLAAISCASSSGMPQF